MNHCTLFPDLWYGECCEGHDGLAEAREVSWIKSNAELAYCIWASSYSPRVTNRWYKILWGRYIAPPAVFLGTSTIGWLWRFYALNK